MPLERTTNEAGDVVIHPHEALQSIAVQLARGNEIAIAQLQATARVEAMLGQLVKAAEAGAEQALKLQAAGGGDMAEKLLAPIMKALAGRAERAVEPRPSIGLVPKLPPREHVAPSGTARLVAATPAPVVEAE